MLFLGIDLGTGGIRSVIVDGDGRVCSENQIPFNQVNLSDKDGESEQNPKEWIRAFEELLEVIFSQSSNREIRAIAIDGTSGTVLPVAPKGEALGNALMHNDMRAVKEAARCTAVFNGSCSPTFALPKILWMQDNWQLPENTYFFHSSDFLYSWLSGTTKIATDFTNAMKTGVDLNREDWSEHEILRALNLPPIIRPGKSFETVSGRLRKKWSLKNEVVLVSGSTDSNAAFYASGATQTGDWASTIGTTLAIKGLSRTKLLDESGRIYCHKYPDGFWLPGGASNAGAEIIRKNFAGKEQGIEENLKNSEVLTDGFVYPSIRVGERLPIASQDFRPFNTLQDQGEKVFYQACLEGIAFTEAMVFDLIRSLGGTTKGSLFAMGGTTKSSIGLQIRADVHQKILTIPANPNSAFGAAILAAAGYNHQSVAEASKAMVQLDRHIHPRSKYEDFYKSKYQEFLAFFSK